ncbi:hypothetical protein AVEN_3587-1 [Araneus ventricosus]|uniref:Uncharacterized protein n=1 Tax=Araneus ventricosus TaxID=182803 RepID=A0A4Y2KS07_ARAVE|nr:hypothetical protein AVEN_3587-1 [Araneus ventricosus]
MANQLWSHINANKFHSILFDIIFFFIPQGLDDFNYVGLLEECWHHSPDSFKDEIKKREKLFKVTEVTLNFDEENASLSLPGTVSKYIA